MKNERNRAREWAALLFGGVIYALFYALGSQIDQSGTTVLGTSFARFALALFILVVIYQFLALVTGGMA